MALMERVATLIRANLNDLIDQAEDPEKMIKQLILDMQNQLMQVKTQVAMAIADEHLLRRKQAENEGREADWVRKAELALEKKDDELARAALERSLSSRRIAENFRQQVEDQRIQVENFRTALLKLEEKLVEAQAKSDVLMAQHRRARALNKAVDARAATQAGGAREAFARMKRKVEHAEALGQARAEIFNGDTVAERLAALEKHDQVERLLTELKARKALPA